MASSTHSVSSSNIDSINHNDSPPATPRVQGRQWCILTNRQRETRFQFFIIEALLISASIGFGIGSAIKPISDVDVSIRAFISGYCALSAIFIFFAWRGDAL